VGDRNGLLVTFGNVVTRKRETRGVEMVKALINSFLLTHGESELAKKQVAAVSIDLIEGAPQFETIEHVGFDARTKKQIERLTRKELWGGQDRGDLPRDSQAPRSLVDLRSGGRRRAHQQYG
jgi:hypothetical protein